MRRIAFLIVLLAAATAQAQRGIDAQLFHPALDSYGIFTVERAQTPHQWDFGTRLFVNYAGQPLRLSFFDATSMAPRRQAAMNYQATLDFVGHIGLFDWLEAAVDVPVSAQTYTGAYGTYGSAADPTLARTGFYAAEP